MRSAWSAILHYFERGDLVPLLVLVSAVHYSAVLAGRDWWPVAIAIGVLVDMGHYRWVRAAARYNGASRREAALRWAFALAMTGVSLAYHQRYYQDWWLSAPLPFLIASLAWLAKVDNRSAANAAPAASGRAKASDAPSERQFAGSEAERTASELAFACSECQRTFATQNALNAHRRSHAEEQKG